MQRGLKYIESIKTPLLNTFPFLKKKVWPVWWWFLNFSGNDETTLYWCRNRCCTHPTCNCCSGSCARKEIEVHQRIQCCLRSIALCAFISTRRTWLGTRHHSHTIIYWLAGRVRRKATCGGMPPPRRSRGGAQTRWQILDPVRSAGPKRFLRLPNGH